MVLQTPIHFGDVRQQQYDFLGREDVLARIDAAIHTCRLNRGYVLVKGSPGMGKTAIASEWLTRQGQHPELPAGAIKVPHHFIRGGFDRWEQPAVIIANLALQVEQMFPDVAEELIEPSPRTRLRDILGLVSRRVLAPQRRRLVLVLDGLDEIARSSTRRSRFSQLLPSILPYGVFFLCTSRPLHAELEVIESWAIESIDLDHPDWAASNHSLCSSFWARVAPDVPGSIREKALELGAGNILYAVGLSALKPTEWRTGVLPRGLLEFTRLAWERINALQPQSARTYTLTGLGLLTAARESLPISLLAELTGWPLDGGREVFLGAARPYLLEEETEDGEKSYRLCHRSFRDFLGRELGDALPGHHRILAGRLGWPPSEQMFRRRYALRHTVAHHVKGGDRTAAIALCTDMVFLRARLEAGDIAEVAADLNMLAEGETPSSFLAALAAAFQAEFDALRTYPTEVAMILYNRLILLGWKDAAICKQCSIHPALLPLRLLHPLQDAHSAKGHSEAVRATSSTADGRFALSAADDMTIRLWDIETGVEQRVIGAAPGKFREVSDCAATMDGRFVFGVSADGKLRKWELSCGAEVWNVDAHTESINAVALTPDCSLVITASSDRSLKVWTASEGRAVRTLVGHDDVILACAVAPDGRTLVSGSAEGSLYVWDLAEGRLLHGLAGHDARINDCTVTCDGQYCVTASADRTLRIWELATGNLIRVLQGHTEAVLSCAVASDGRIFSAAEDRTLRIWEPREATASVVLQGPNRFTSIHFRAPWVIAGDAAGNVWMLGAQIHDTAREPATAVQSAFRANNSPIERSIEPSDPLSLSDFAVQTVLLVSASPDSAVRIRVDEEFREVIERMRGARHRDRFQFVQIQAARFTDLVTALLEYRPHVLHISSHGEPDGALLFEGKAGVSKRVSRRQLLKLLKALKDDLRMVVLNACNSQAVAKDLPEVIDFAIGMSDQISDQAAIDFSVAFYESLGFGRSIETAFNVALAGLDDLDDQVPQLFRGCKGTAQGSLPESATSVHRAHE